MITCTHCGFSGPHPKFTNASDGWACPRCGMDESGLEMSDARPAYDRHEDGPWDRFDISGYHGP